MITVPEWVQVHAFVVDIANRLNSLNTVLQGCNNVVTQYYDGIGAFRYKFVLWGMPLTSNNPAHIRCLKDLFNAGSADDFGQCKDNISSLLHILEWRFQVFNELETIQNPL